MTEWLPPKARDLPGKWVVLERQVDAHPLGGIYENNGNGPRSGLRVIITSNLERDDKMWVHVSFSRKGRMPTYEDTTHVKKVFLGDESKAISILPPKSEHVNFHPYCLHLFMCLGEDPLPDFRPMPGMI